MTCSAHYSPIVHKLWLFEMKLNNQKLTSYCSIGHLIVRFYEKMFDLKVFIRIGHNSVMKMPELSKLAKK